MKIIAVTGSGQNSGKTSAVEELVKEFKSRGYRVGTIKQIHEQGFSLDKRGKDTWRHREAGADIVIAASPDEIAAIKSVKKNRIQEALDILKSQKLDIVICEGHPGMDVPMVYALREGGPIKEKPIDKNVLCVVSLTPEKVDINLPIYHVVEERNKVADVIIETLIKGERGAGEE